MDTTIENIINMITGFVSEYGINVAAAIAILVAGLMIAGRIQKLVQMGLEKTKRVDPMVISVLAKGARYIVVLVTLMAVLDRFGVETTSFIALLGAMGLAVGLALQGTLSNVAAGFMILFLRPFKSGDYIEGGGQAGTVDTVSLFVTYLQTPDNVEIIIPNNQLWNSSIKNYSHHATRRLDLMFGIGYGDDLEHAMKILRDLIDDDSRFHKDPEPLVVVGELGASSVDLVVRGWCDSSDYWGLKWDMLKTVKLRFDAEGISIPYPQTDVHLYNTQT